MRKYEKAGEIGNALTLWLFVGIIKLGNCETGSGLEYK